jgi:hypothetical protein
MTGQQQKDYETALKHTYFYIFSEKKLHLVVPLSLWMTFCSLLMTVLFL